MNRDELIELLFDKNAYEEEREEAAGYLADFPDKHTLDALTRKAKDIQETDYVKGKAGESIGLIMVKLGYYLEKYVNDIDGVAYNETKAVIREHRPDWYKKYFHKE